jgi:hypothetical protein
MGVAVLTPAAIAYLAGLPLLGAVLGLMVAALALLSAATGFCTGCQIYKLAARVRGLGRGHGHIERIEPSDFGGALAPNTVVQFTHPLCSDCHRPSDERRQLRAAADREPRDLRRADRRQPGVRRGRGAHGRHR